MREGSLREGLRARQSRMELEQLIAKILKCHEMPRKAYEKPCGMVGKRPTRSMRRPTRGATTTSSSVASVAMFVSVFCTL